MKLVKVLFVDDETVYADNMAKLLGNRGYQTVTANSGDEALEKLEKGDFDVVVLDLKMPGLDGIATLREMNRQDLLTETLILTGHGSIDTALEATRIGAFDYLTKPCEVGELVEKIEEAMDRKSAVEKAERDEKIKKIIESPSAVFTMVKKPASKRTDR